MADIIRVFKLAIICLCIVSCVAVAGGIAAVVYVQHSWREFMDTHAVEVTNTKTTTVKQKAVGGGTNIYVDK